MTIALSTLATIGSVASLAGGAVGAYGAIESGEASGAAASYQSQVAANNAIIAGENAQYAKAAGEVQVTASELKTAATIGAIKTNQAASGLDVNSGSNEDVQSSAKELGELDALTVRNNAARQAYGYQVQSTSFTQQSQLSSAQSEQDLTAGMFGAGSSILGGATSATNNYARYLQLNGMTVPTPLSAAQNPFFGGAPGAGGMT